MANKTDTIKKQRAQKKVVKIDLYNRYEVVGSGNLAGEIYIPRDTDNLATGQTVTLTLV